MVLKFLTVLLLVFSGTMLAEPSRGVVNSGTFRRQQELRVLPSQQIFTLPQVHFSQIAERLPGFLNLRKIKNKLVEQIGNVISVIDVEANTGLVSGAHSKRTIDELRVFFAGRLEQLEFLARKRDAKQGNILDFIKAKRFLARYGSASNGNFTFNLNVNTGFADVDADGKPIYPQIKDRFGFPVKDEKSVAMAALNYMLNDISNMYNPVGFEDRQMSKGGLMGVKLGTPAFRQHVLDMIKQSDPTSQCTGTIRINAAIKFLFDNENYYNIISAPKTRTEFSIQYGVPQTKEDSNGNKIIIGNNESGVVHAAERVLEFNTITKYGVGAAKKAGICFGSYDIRKDIAPGVQSFASSVLKAGVQFVHGAEEWLCTAPNGFMRRYLFAGDGKIQTEAPASVASSARLLGPEVSVGSSCMDCHANGFNGGGYRHVGGPRDPKTGFPKKYSEITAAGARFHDVANRVDDSRAARAGGNRPSFIDHAEYRRIANYAQDELYQDALFKAKAKMTYKTDDASQPRSQLPLLPKIAATFAGPVSQKDAEREMGLRKGELSGWFSLHGKKNERGDLTVTREKWDDSFCGLFNQKLKNRSSNSSTGNGSTKSTSAREHRSGSSIERETAGPTRPSLPRY